MGRAKNKTEIYTFSWKKVIDHLKTVGEKGVKFTYKDIFGEGCHRAYSQALSGMHGYGILDKTEVGYSNRLPTSYKISERLSNLSIEELAKTNLVTAIRKCKKS